jgi:hypothetical protein
MKALSLLQAVPWRYRWWSPFSSRHSLPSERHISHFEGRPWFQLYFWPHLFWQCMLSCDWAKFRPIRYEARGSDSIALTSSKPSQWPQNPLALPARCLPYPTFWLRWSTWPDAQKHECVMCMQTLCVWEPVLFLLNEKKSSTLLFK